MKILVLLNAQMVALAIKIHINALYATLHAKHVLDQMQLIVLIVEILL